MKENEAAAESHDYEYDEAHHEADPVVGTRTPRRVTAPSKPNLDQGGDFGYDEAHDFGAP